MTMRIVRVVPIRAVDDIESAVHTYRDVLGMVEVTRLDWLVTLSDSRDMRRQIGITTRDPSAPCNPQVSIQVDDVDDAYNAATEAGVEIIYPLTDEPWGSRRFFFADAAGTIVNVLSAR